MLGTTKPVGISQHSVVLMFVHPSTVFFDTLTTPSKKIHSLSLCRHLPLPSVTLAQGASLVSLPTVGLILEVFPGAPLKHSSRWPSKYSNGWISKQTSGLVKTCDVCSNNNNTQIFGSLFTFSCLLSHLSHPWGTYHPHLLQSPYLYFHLPVCWIHQTVTISYTPCFICFSVALPPKRLRIIRDKEPRMSTSTFTLLPSSNTPCLLSPS